MRSVIMMLLAALIVCEVSARDVVIDLGANCGNSFALILEKVPSIDTPNLEVFLWERIHVSSNGTWSHSQHATSAST